jgi:osmotically-inducible protein OsmY
VEGVRSVEDLLSVVNTDADRTSNPDARDTTATTAGDRAPAWITTKIQAQYVANSEIKPWNRDVTSSSTGVVALRGEVDEATDRDDAVRIARESDGVTRVDDQLRVRGCNDSIPADG